MRQDPKGKRTELLAEGQKPEGPAPPGLKPEEVEVPLERMAPEIRDVPVAEAPPNRTESHDRELPLQLRVLGSKSEELFDGGRTEAALIELAEHVIGLHVLIEVDELGHNFLGAFALHGEVLGSDVVVLPVVPSGRDHLLEGETVVDGDGVGGADGSYGLAVRRQRFTKNLAKRLLILDPPLHDGLFEVIWERAKYGSGELPELTDRHFRRGGTMCHGVSSLSAFQLILAYPFISHHARIKSLPFWLQLLTNLSSKRAKSCNQYASRRILKRA